MEFLIVILILALCSETVRSIISGIIQAILVVLYMPFVFIGLDEYKKKEEKNG